MRAADKLFLATGIFLNASCAMAQSPPVPGQDSSHELPAAPVSNGRRGEDFEVLSDSPCARQPEEVLGAVRNLGLDALVQQELCKDGRRPLKIVRSVDFAVATLPECQQLEAQLGAQVSGGVRKVLMCLIYAESGFDEYVNSRGLLQLNPSHRAKTNELVATYQPPDELSFNALTGAYLYCDARNRSWDAAAGVYPSLRHTKYNQCMH